MAFRFSAVWLLRCTCVASPFKGVKFHSFVTTNQHTLKYPMQPSSYRLISLLAHTYSLTAQPAQPLAARHGYVSAAVGAGFFLHTRRLKPSGFGRNSRGLADVSTSDTIAITSELSIQPI